MKRYITLWRELKIEDRLLWLYTALIPFVELYVFKLSGKKIILADFVFMLLFMFFIWGYLIYKQKIVKSHLGFALSVMLILFSVSMVNSVNLLTSTFELIGLIYLILIFLLIINIITDHQKARLLLMVYFITAVFLSLAGLASFFLNLFGITIGNNLLFYSGMESISYHFARIKFFFESPNMALSYLHVAFVLGAIIFMLEKRNRFKSLIFFGLVIIFIAAFLTGSRRIAGFLLTLFILFCFYKHGKRSLGIKYIAFFAFMIFFALSIINTIWVVFPLRVNKDMGQNIVGVKINDAYSLHLLQVAVSLNMFKRHPYFGIGLGTYNLHFQENVDWDWLASSFGSEAYPNWDDLVRNKTLNFDPHSVYLGTLAETGIIGFTGLLYFFLSYLFLLSKRLTQEKEQLSSRRIIVGCILAGFIGFLFNGLNLDILSMRHFWLMLAVGLVG